MTSAFPQTMPLCGEKSIVYRNRNRTLEFRITTNIGSIAGSILWFSVKRDIMDPDASAVILKRSANNGGSDAEALITDPTNRYIEFYILPADTVSLTVGDYVADAVIELPSGSRLSLIEPFLFRVEEPVTEA